MKIPFELEDMRMTNNLLRSNDFAPAWIEFGKEIKQDLEAAEPLQSSTCERK
jgi:hypothetical protein